MPSEDPATRTSSLANSVQPANLTFLDADTGNLLSATTFNPGAAPSITVVRTGDVDQGFDPTLITDHAPILTGKTTLEHR